MKDTVGDFVKGSVKKALDSDGTKELIGSHMSDMYDLGHKAGMRLALGTLTDALVQLQELVVSMTEFCTQEEDEFEDKVKKHQAKLNESKNDAN